MSFVRLRESVARSKAKLKNRFNFSPNNASLGASPAQAAPSSTHPGSALPPQSPGSSEINVKQPAKNGMIWLGVKTLLAVLESSADAFGPLKSAIGGLNKCIDIYERASKGRKDFIELHEKLDGLLSDLAEYEGQRMGLEMTNSVNRLCRAITLELKNVEEIQKQSRAEELAGAMEVSNEILECYRRIHNYVERLTLNANMSILKEIDKQATEARLLKMSPFMSAVYNSAESDYLRRGGCTPGTREPQIDLLLEWARHSDTGRTCWMNGMAGTGKTTIAYSICDNLNQTFELGASFFCSRVIPECRQVKYIIPSIAYQLARFSLPFRYALDKILESDPDVHTRALKIQYQKLIVDPLTEVQKKLPPDFIVVIDALDECEDEHSLGQMLKLLLSTHFSLPIRFLLSSRPEPEITRQMMGRAGKQGEIRMALHDLDLDAVKLDIETYMKDQLQHVPLTDAQWLALVKKCGVLFIYASTTCRYVKQGYIMETLEEAVNAIIAPSSSPAEHRNEPAIDHLYSTILTAAFNKTEMMQTNKVKMRNLLETVICAVEPMTTGTLAGLLGLDSIKQATALLQPLRSVLNITETTGLVTTLHASFPDFMFSPDRAVDFFCAQPNRHAELVKACLSTIDSVEPKFNICGLESSHFLDSEIEELDEIVSQAISPELLYACRHWSSHLYLGEYQDRLIDIVCNFFSQRLLLWMEVLNLTGNIRFGASIILNAERWCSERSIPDDMKELIHDAWKFVSVYASHPVSQSTPHIYVSMLPFWPRSGPIWDVYMSRTTGMLRPTGTAISRQQLALLATWNVPYQDKYSITLSADGTRLLVGAWFTMLVLDTSTGDEIASVTGSNMVDVCSTAISPDGTRVAFGGVHTPIHLWDIDSSNDVATTNLLPEYHSGVVSTTFSPDGLHIAFGSARGGVYIYSVQKGGALGPFEGHTTAVCSVSYSPDGLYLASGSGDTTIRVWDTLTGHQVGVAFAGHTSFVNSVSYSPDGSRIISASLDRTIRVWDSQTGLTILGPLNDHSDGVNSVAFAPNGSLIASGSSDKTIRVYDAATGQTVLGPLQEHDAEVTAVIFSPDNSRLFSCAHDDKIRIWDVQKANSDTSGTTLTTPILSKAIASIRYSHSGLHMICGLHDGALQVWDVHTGQVALGPLHGHVRAVTSADCSPDGAYIASASSSDKTLRIWDRRTGQDLHGPLQAHSQTLNSVRFTPDSLFVASGSDNGTVRIWDIKSGQTVRILFEGSKDTIVSLGLSPDGSRIASGSTSGLIQVVNWNTQEIIVGPFQSYKHPVRFIEFSSDGSRILSPSYEKSSIYIWDAQTGEEVIVIGGDDQAQFGRVVSAGFSPGGHYIVSCTNSYNGDYFTLGVISGQAIHIWDAQTGHLVLSPLLGHTDVIIAVQFSPDGSHVASCSGRTIRFWDVSSCREGVQTIESNDTDEVSDSNSNLDNVLGAWYLNDNGWVISAQKQRLVWVPSHLRECLLWPLNTSMISNKGSFKLEFDGANIGERWVDCYRP